MSLRCSWQQGQRTPTMKSGKQVSECHISKWFSKDELAAIGWARETEGQTIVIEAEEIPDILKAIRVIKKCKAFHQCLEDRDRGKVKHCY